MYAPPTDLSHRSFVIIGAGTLGRRIALMWLTRPDTIVHLHDTRPETLHDAKAYIEQTLPSTIASRVPEGSPGTLKLFENRAEALKGAWIVVDCIPEIQQAKIDLLGELDKALPEEVIIATNSSSYMAREIVEKVRYRDRVINTHYYWPPEQVPVEIMPSAETHESIAPLLVRESKRHGLVPSLARKESLGLIANRIWAAIKRESLLVVAEGVSTPQEIDGLVESALGLRPFAKMDIVGLDVVKDIEEHYLNVRPDVTRREVIDVLDGYIEKGRLGVKSGEGFYGYP